MMRSFARGRQIRDKDRDRDRDREMRRHFALQY